MSDQKQKFGTGQPVISTAQPSLGRVFVNGMLIGAGWMTAAGIIKFAINAFKGGDDEVEQPDEEGYTPSERAAAHDAAFDRRRKKRIERLLDEQYGGDED